ncbi:hypothetical protein [Bacillus alkalicola]|uniref:Radical SAM/SPASM domain-containing protein n=1 Tax=Evansella alkalicola TaxID=745819 RepID=A0ABS6JYN3_9BACI|nr:hypothetical protein [Bacillus alkalicola]MBU9723603.1 hypothetical protein [Bacillus alkalicola]
MYMGQPHSHHGERISHPQGNTGLIDYNKNPFIVIWEVTRACELKCLHCRADAQTKPS